MNRKYSIPEETKKLFHIKHKMSQTLKQDLIKLKAHFEGKDVEITDLDDETIEVTQEDRVWTLSCVDYPSSTSVFCGEEQHIYSGTLLKIVLRLLEGKNLNVFLTIRRRK
jgi:hypothetical protein